jgi:AcrR family transcriptional regulator
MRPEKTRQNLLRAAQQIFSEKGFSGARVDEIARRARANKAMIYYHFGTKEELYQTVLLELFGGVLWEVQRLEREVTDPRERLLGFYTGLVGAFAQHPDLPRIMMREVLAGGTHMDQAAAEVLGAIIRFVGACIEQGAAEGTLRSVNPMLVHLTMIGPILVFFVSEPFRARLLPEALPEVPPPTQDDLVGHLRELLTCIVGRGRARRDGGS